MRVIIPEYVLTTFRPGNVVGVEQYEQNYIIITMYVLETSNPSSIRIQLDLMETDIKYPRWRLPMPFGDNLKIGMQTYHVYSIQYIKDIISVELELLIQ